MKGLIAPGECVFVTLVLTFWMEDFQNVGVIYFVGMNEVNGPLQAQLLQLFCDNPRSLCLNILLYSGQSFSFLSLAVCFICSGTFLSFAIASVKS